jgi:hypothetical protein
MNNCSICWFFTHILVGILIFKVLTARRLYKSLGVKGLIYVFLVCKTIFSSIQYLTILCVETSFYSLIRFRIIFSTIVT